MRRITTIDGTGRRARTNLLKPGRPTAIALACTVMASVGVLSAQAPAPQIIPLAQGSSPQHVVNLHSKGPTDVLQTQLVFQPDADTGWHTHPGPVVVVVKTGALTEVKSNGCIVVHPAGSVFFESKDEVHRAVNQTGGVTEVYATFISPAGAQPLIPAPDPGGVCRPEDRSPYFHNGSAASLGDVLQFGDKRFHISASFPQEKIDLIALLNAL